MTAVNIHTDVIKRLKRAEEHIKNIFNMLDD